MADVAQNAHSSNTTERNGSIVVGAPKGASDHSTKYVIAPTVNSTVGGLNIISGYKVQGKYSSTDMTGDGQIYWYANPGATVAELQYLQLNSSGTGFVRLNGSGANVELRGSFIGA